MASPGMEGSAMALSNTLQQLKQEGGTFFNLFFSSSLLRLFLVGTRVHLLEPRSLTCIFLLQFFFLGSVPVIIIAIVAPAVMEKKINLGDCRHGTLRLFFE